MTREDVMERTRQLIKENIPDLNDIELKEDTRLNDQANVDSMGFILVMAKLEAEFDSQVPDEEWRELATIGDVADAIMAHRSSKD